MPFYHRMGTIPPKRHTQFHKPDGGLYREQVMGTKGFSGIQSILYHHHAPTEVVKVQLLSSCEPEYEGRGALSHRHFRTNGIKEAGDAVSGRQYLLGNEDLMIGIVKPAEAMNYFYRNADGDEPLFVHEGTGKLETMFGTLSYRPGDYIVLPVGTIYRLVSEAGKSKLLVLETNSWITPPKRYRNEYGQSLEHSPYCERDIRVPEKLETFTDIGEFEVRTRKGGMIHSHTLGHHPLDVAGWDGYLYPWIFNIEDFEPITGRVHMPPRFIRHSKETTLWCVRFAPGF
ncbi:homogentisate 1,2-dioxygenase [Paenibacillus sp. P26]|nr:homogentisate 1,2-dioxygenase [Paenibacillus sp. P26]